MDIGTISMRYAKALMQYALSTQSTHQFYDEMRMLEHSLRAHPELRQALGNPILSVRTKYQLVCSAAVGKADVRRELSRFITLLLKNGREEMLHYICLSYMHLYRQHHHIGTARLISAVPLNTEMKARITEVAQKVLHARMEIETETDATLLGGFVFDVNDYRLDASVATRLKRVKQQFIAQNRRIV